MANFVREIADITAFAATTTDFGNTLKNVNAHKDGATALTTDISGAVNISFQVPHEGSNKFRCGTHEIKIMDVTKGGREDKAGSIARAIYTATGFLDTVHQDIESTRVLEIEGSTTVVDNTPTYSHNDGNERHSDGLKINNDNYIGDNTWSDRNNRGGIDENLGDFGDVRDAQSDYEAAAGLDAPSGWSDVRLKTDIEFSHSFEDLQLYTFAYIWNNTKKYLGVLAQDILQTKYADAVTEENGYYKVDYSKLPVDMEEI